MNIFSTPVSNIAWVTSKLLQLLKVKANRSTIIANLQAHPDYPSLLSISDCLSSLNIDHMALQLNRKNYPLITTPFITYFPANGGSFVLVHQTGNENVTISDGRYKKQHITKSAFLESWTGIALMARAGQHSKEPDYAHHRSKAFFQKMRWPVFLLTLLTAIFLAAVAHEVKLPQIILITLKMSGLIISILLLLQHINAAHPLIRKLCRPGSKNDCSAILNSAAAQVTPWLSWAELGFFYFAGTFLVLLFFPVITAVLSWLNLLALPYTLYSLLYQYSKKTWCVFCCAVQGIFIAERIAFSSVNGHFPLLGTSDGKTLLAAALCFLLSAISWTLLKPLLLQAISAKTLQQQLKFIKYKSGLFLPALKRQPYYDIPDELRPVLLGSTTPVATITLISNVFCKPCEQAHEELEALLLQRSDIQAKLLFVHPQDAENEMTKIAVHLLALDYNGDKNRVLQALHAWYHEKDKQYDKWALKFPVSIPPAISQVSKKQKEWFNKVKITATPTILVDGHELPEPWRIADLKYLMN